MEATTQQIPVWRQVRAMANQMHGPAAFAEALVQAAGIKRPPVDVASIADLLEVHVRHVNNPGWSGAVHSNDLAAHIWINADEAPSRQRFTLAHELGHLLLHPRGMMFRDATFAGDRREVEANKFAAALLMPMTLLRPLAYPRPDAKELASQFAVSKHAMEIRLLEMYGRPIHW